jgi:hypothetical protein
MWSHSKTLPLAYLLFCVGIWVGCLRYIPEEAHMYSWFIDLYVPCTGYNLYKNTTYIHAPLFLHDGLAFSSNTTFFLMPFIDSLCAIQNTFVVFTATSLLPRTATLLVDASLLLLSRSLALSLSLFSLVLLPFHHPGRTSPPLLRVPS